MIVTGHSQACSLLKCPHGFGGSGCGEGEEGRKKEGKREKKGGRGEKGGKRRKERREKQYHFGVHVESY